MRRLARKLALFQVGALVLLVIGLASCGYPTAPECGSPNPAHTAAISADPAVACFLNAAKHCKKTALDGQCTSFAQLPDWGRVLTGCTPPVDCYSDLGAPVLDPPAVPPSLPP